MKTTYFKLFIAITLLITHSELKSQVTIGSDIAPNSGTLLDLKEYNPTNTTTDNTTSTKGMMLPRVNLTKLIPDTNEEFAASIGSNSSWDKANHIGLLVYNVNENLCADGESIYKNPYVWDGTRWNLLGASGKEKLASGVYRFTDSRDGQSYLARNFGNAGDWMLENLAYVPNNNDVGFTDFEEDPFTGLINKDSKLYCYPGEIDALYEIGTIPSTWKKEYGILYSWQGATNGQNTNFEEQGQVDATDVPGANEVEILYGKIRGVCPEGWHLPSDREWNKLEKVIYNSIVNYSCNNPSDQLTPSDWNPDWEWGISGNGIGWRGSRTLVPQGWTMINAVLEGIPGHGNAMKAPSFPDGNLATIANVPEQKTYGRSIVAADGGFAVWLVGVVHGGIGSAPDKSPFASYGRSANYWTSSRRDISISGGAYVWARNFSGTVSGVYRDQFHNRGALNPVRCKKD